MEETSNVTSVISKPLNANGLRNEKLEYCHFSPKARSTIGFPAKLLPLAHPFKHRLILVTHNARDFSEAAARFGLRIVTPGELLKELKS